MRIEIEMPNKKNKEHIKLHIQTCIVGRQNKRTVTKWMINKRGRQTKVRNENMKNINRRNVVGYLSPLCLLALAPPLVVNNKATAIPVLMFDDCSTMDHLKVSRVLSVDSEWLTLWIVSLSLLFFRSSSAVRLVSV